MSDYACGFDQGFLAAIRASGRSSNGANGYTDDCNVMVKKISIGFDQALFDRINSIARDSGQSFSSTVRHLVRNSLG